MATKEEIKNSAYYYFSHYGYEGTTMQDIAKAVGLKKQSLYSHFESKEELYMIILQEEQKKITAEISSAYHFYRWKPAEEMLFGIFAKCADIFSDKERLLLWKRTFIYFGSEPKTSEKAVSSWHFDNIFRDSLYEDFTKSYSTMADIEVFRMLFISYMLMIQGYLDWMMVMGHDKKILNNVWKIFWSGAKNYFQK